MAGVETFLSAAWLKQRPTLADHRGQDGRHYAWDLKRSRGTALGRLGYGGATGHAERDMYHDDAGPYRTVGRSLYSMIVGFPVSCFVLTLLTDLAYWKTDSYLWETISVWLLTIGLFGAGLAILAGLVDLVRSRRVRGLGQPWLRLAGHLVALALAVVNVLVHSRDGYTAVVPQGLILSALTVLVLLAAAFAGRSAAPGARAERLA